METTEYYDEYLRYFTLANTQQEKCNLGTVAYLESRMGDDLLEHVELYDVVERKFAGFSQIMHDCYHGWTPSHPYWTKMERGIHSRYREVVAKNWTGKHSDFGLAEWLYVFIVHRVTGSGINYAVKPSGYHNSILFSLHESKTIEDMVKIIKNYQFPFYTSVGYQFPQFPKPEGDYKKGGDYYLGEFAPRLARDLADFLEKGRGRDLREIGSFMLNWNTRNGLKQYHFQYAAIVADIADWYPRYVNPRSPFYYGSNAKECISYLAINTQKKKQIDFLDDVMERIYEDTNSFPYNAEDVCCDFIRWVENFVKPGASYDHLDRDAIWSSCRIKDHPFGRQRAMLQLGLVDSFNNMNHHPSDSYVLDMNGMSVADYKRKVNELVA